MPVPVSALSPLPRRQLPNRKSGHLPGRNPVVWFDGQRRLKRRPRVPVLAQLQIRFRQSVVAAHIGIVELNSFEVDLDCFFPSSFESMGDCLLLDHLEESC